MAMGLAVGAALVVSPSSWYLGRPPGSARLSTRPVPTGSHRKAGFLLGGKHKPGQAALRNPN